MFENKKIHMIGIGGISMSGIAGILLSFNCKITGYDVGVTDITKSLNEKGIEVSNKPNLENVKNADIVVYTAAIHEDNEELFNIEGIITIDNKTYQVFGEIESEEDEIETKIKVVTGENEYFVIEQEKEVDEEEFVYTSYINNKKQNEYSISYEVEDNEIEIKIEMLTNGKVEKLVSKIENNEIK